MYVNANGTSVYTFCVREVLRSSSEFTICCGGQGSICRQCRVEMGTNLLEDIGMHRRFPDVFSGTHNENDGVSTESVYALVNAKENFHLQHFTLA